MTCGRFYSRLMGIPVTEAFMTYNALSAAILALCLTAAEPLSAAPQAAQPLEAPPLLETITLWLSLNFDLPTSEQAPRLATLPEADLVTRRYGPEVQVAPGQVVALYDDTSQTIYLSEGWTGRSPAELSVLVHEVVHHLQSSSDLRFACPAERERLAYRAQGEWLALFGETLTTAFDIDPATLLVSTVCFH